MKKTFISLLALAAVSTTAFAFERRDTDPVVNGINNSGTMDTRALAVEAPKANSEWLYGKYGMTKDPEELRRWSEKN